MYFFFVMVDEPKETHTSLKAGLQNDVSLTYRPHQREDIKGAVL